MIRNDEGVGVLYFKIEELESSILKARSRSQSRSRSFSNWDVGVGVGVAEKNLQLRSPGFPESSSSENDMISIPRSAALDFIYSVISSIGTTNPRVRSRRRLREASSSHICQRSRTEVHLKIQVCFQITKRKNLAHR